MILHPFHISSTGTDFPEKMNNPFDYEPHPLCIQICKELQTYLENKKEWREEIDRGKMFGVLIVEKPSDIHEGRQLGYLAAYSGQIGGRSDWDDFVPAVFDSRGFCHHPIHHRNNFIKENKIIKEKT